MRTYVFGFGFYEYNISLIHFLYIILNFSVLIHYATLFVQIEPELISTTNQSINQSVTLHIVFPIFRTNCDIMLVTVNYVNAIISHFLEKTTVQIVIWQDGKHWLNGQKRSDNKILFAQNIEISNFWFLCYCTCYFCLWFRQVPLNSKIIRGPYYISSY